MKKLLPILLVAGFTMLAPGCKEKKKTADIITIKYEPKKPQAPITMERAVRTNQVEWMGNHYSITIVREAADSLPMVKDETQQAFIDNRISLTILRSDSTVFFKHVFTKSSFASLLTDNYRKNALLSSMIFHEMDDNELEFAISVSMPESDDEFIPIELKIDRQGNIAIERDTLIDTWGGDSDDEETDND